MVKNTLSSNDDEDFRQADFKLRDDSQPKSMYTEGCLYFTEKKALNPCHLKECFVWKSKKLEV